MLVESIMAIVETEDVAVDSVLHFQFRVSIANVSIVHTATHSRVHSNKHGGSNGYFSLCVANVQLCACYVCVCFVCNKEVCAIQGSSLNV